jgi:hypothetical protein
VGLNAYVASGTPVSRTVRYMPSPPQPYSALYLGRESDGRTPALSQLDLHLQHEFRLGGEKRLQLLANVLNLFDQRAATNIHPFQLEMGAALLFTADDLFRGIDTRALIQEQGIPENPMFLMASEFQQPREIRFGMRFAF